MNIDIRNAAVRICRARSDIESFIGGEFLPGIRGETPDMDEVGSLLDQVERLEKVVKSLIG